jgi:hypothetical protein
MLALIHGPPRARRVAEIDGIGTIEHRIHE